MRVVALSVRVLTLFESWELEFPRVSYEFSKVANPIGPRDSRYRLGLGSILAHKKRELGLVVNMEFVGLCLGFPTSYRVIQLDVPS